MTLLNSLLHLFFPHICEGCGSDELDESSLLCARCFSDLPETGFTGKKDNIVEKIFFGRIKVEKATSAFYFTKDSLIQRMMIQLKYKDNKAAGHYLGKLLGMQLQACPDYDGIDMIIPLPLNPKKQKKRGYNQAEEISKGMFTVWPKPVVTNIAYRQYFTQTQTHKNRISRWQTMDGVFAVRNEDQLAGKHVLLVDDVITTGATLEACGQAILAIPGTRLSIASVAYTMI
ncbi:phosphoribosyltransferase family protein [Danxiaibacter flavus]|uniref:Phosphoribosyltransferase family protein n=1 Tax=Danxiaibacter flavus TaxID=3049108 RepID=A0ABV3ZEU6_9BACT|nr:phosphoribosyltransferase family protein [Chitinophagaceae bacterium DXS]